ncbi:lysophospholipid acyltransferase family protein [Pedobacter sp. SYP-B3415]|uniref:lysophospholipid acyltransferase family protein n=1 Tax=Pedobacter sp. SYP-B3415 TaxID=2496641 RepID=UPI00101C8379|nr:lysophospholipid acyltransferase family protein [Pedobacter sp. SYP-B3415]
MINKVFAYLGISLLRLLSLFPLPVLYFFARLAYYLLYYIISYRKKTVISNLHRAFPEKSSGEIIQVGKRFYRYLADLVFEIIKMHSLSESELRRRVKFTNTASLKQWLENGGSALACTGHYGNWEWATLAMGTEISQRLVAIYKPLNQGQFDRYFIDMRSKFGNTLVPMRQTLRALAAYRTESTLFAFAGDQSPAKTDAKYWVPFFNQPTAALPGIEKISRQTNRPVFYFTIRRPRRGYYEVDCKELCMEPRQTEDLEITGMHFASLEKCIKEQPEFWLWSHNRWKHQPE